MSALHPPGLTDYASVYGAIRAVRQRSVYYRIGTMLGWLSYLIGDEFVGGVAVVACVAAGCLMWRNLRKHRAQRREYRERKRQRRQFWGWE